MTVDLNQQLGRAKNALLSFLEERLSIPKIYMDADWDGYRVALLAINRDGVGDVHVVLLTPASAPKASSKRVLEILEQIPAHFKYIAYVNGMPDADFEAGRISSDVLDCALAPDGVAKVGFLAVDFGIDGEPRVQLLFKPERFRAKVAKLADDYIQHHEADWELRA